MRHSARHGSGTDAWLPYWHLASTDKCDGHTKQTPQPKKRPIAAALAHSRASRQRRTTATRQRKHVMWRASCTGTSKRAVREFFHKQSRARERRADKHEQPSRIHDGALVTTWPQQRERTRQEAQRQKKKAGVAPTRPSAGRQLCGALPACPRGACGSPTRTQGFREAHCALRTSTRPACAQRAAGRSCTTDGHTPSLRNADKPPPSPA